MDQRQGGVLTVSVALAFRFPLGEFHATAWDQAVNSGESEWPMSPWRILRALLATWHTRRPDQPAQDVERIIAALSADVPLFRLPGTRPSHTRHYLPSLDHLSGEKGRTAMTLDPRLQVVPADEAIVVWPEADLDTTARMILAELADLLPYLGRAESICAARLLAHDETPAADEAWIVPADGGELRVLVPEPSATRSQLELSPDAMRKAKRLIPEGARWQSYRRGMEPQRPPTVRVFASPTAVRWVVGDVALMRQRDGTLAASGLRSAVLRSIGKEVFARSDRAWVLDGHPEHAVPNHVHAHWLWLDGDGPNRPLTELALWVPDGIPPEFLAGVFRTTQLAAFKESPKGYRPGFLHVQTVGAASDVLPELVGPTRRWRSRTPMLTDRHYKQNRESPDEFIRRELDRELAFRHMPGLTNVRVLADWTGPRPGSTAARGAITGYRRYRWKEGMADRRVGFIVEIELAEDVHGPIALGALSHFGFGLFTPGWWDDGRPGQRV